MVTIGEQLKQLNTEVKEKENNITNNLEELRKNPEDKILLGERNRLVQDLASLNARRTILEAKLPGTIAPGPSSTAVDGYLQRLTKAPPASLVNPRSEQTAESGPLLNNWRPAGLAEGLPPALSHPVFGKFLDHIKSARRPSEEAMEAACQLCVSASAYHDKEIRLTEALRKELMAFLHGADFNPVTSLRGPAETLKPDGVLVDASGTEYLYLVLEVKNDLGASKHPNYQGAMYYGKFWAQRGADEAYLTSCCPAFLVEVLGPHIRVSALSMLDRVTVCPLTPLLNLLWLGHDNGHFLEIARLLTALKDGINAIHDLKLGSTGKPQPSNWQLRGPELTIPAPYQMKGYSAVDPMDCGRLVYLARGAPSPEQVVVKFSPQYGLDVHRAWAELGFAPRVLREEALPGGWMQVEMEYLSPADGWQQLDQLAGTDRADALAAALQALEVVHAGTGSTIMAHGDLRPANCMVRKAPSSKWQVRFLDFEFSGVEGLALYPALMNPAVPWHEDAVFCKALYQEHDKHLLRATGNKQVARQHFRPVAGVLHVGRAATQQARPRAVLPAVGGSAAASWKGARLVRWC